MICRGWWFLLCDTDRAPRSLSLTRPGQTDFQSGFTPKLHGSKLSVLSDIANGITLMASRSINSVGITLPAMSP